MTLPQWKQLDCRCRVRNKMGRKLNPRIKKKNCATKSVDTFPEREVMAMSYMAEKILGCQSEARQGE